MPFIMKKISDTMSYKNERVLFYSAVWPEATGFTAAPEVNRVLGERASDFVKSVREQLYPKAALAFDASSDDGISGDDLPFEVFRVTQTTEVKTENEKLFSVFEKRSERTGGEIAYDVARGLTFDTNSGKLLRLNEIVSGGEIKQRVIDEVKEQIANEIAAGNDSYLPDWRIRAEKLFDTTRFYLNNGTVTVFYRQYDLTFYRLGIKEFALET